MSLICTYQLNQSHQCFLMKIMLSFKLHGKPLDGALLHGGTYVAEIGSFKMVAWYTHRKMVT